MNELEYFEESYEEEHAGIVFIPIMRTYYSLGLLYRIYQDDAQCEAYLKEVYRRCLKYLPEDDRKTAKMRHLLESMSINVDGKIEPLSKQLQNENEDESLIQ